MEETLKAVPDYIPEFGPHSIPEFGPTAEHSIVNCRLSPEATKFQPTELTSDP